jgi:hypothetical protein
MLFWSCRVVPSCHAVAPCLAARVAKAIAAVKLQKSKLTFQELSPRRRHNNSSGAPKRQQPAPCIGRTRYPIRFASGLAAKVTQDQKRADRCNDQGVEKCKMLEEREHGISSFQLNL